MLLRGLRVLPHSLGVRKRIKSPEEPKTAKPPKKKKNSRLQVLRENQVKDLAKKTDWFLSFDRGKRGWRQHWKREPDREIDCQAWDFWGEIPEPTEEEAGKKPASYAKTVRKHYRHDINSIPINFQSIHPKIIEEKFNNKIFLMIATHANIAALKEIIVNIKPLGKTAASRWWWRAKILGWLKRRYTSTRNICSKPL